MTAMKSSSVARIRPCATLLAVLATVGGVIVGSSAAGALAPTGVVTPFSTTETFAYTGAMQTWTVPAGITSVDVVVKGAQGGNNLVVLNGVNYWQSGGAKGGATSATLTVTPGATLNIFVGGAGGTATPSAVGAGGFNGGGDSGTLATGSNPASTYNYAGAGGGASDIRIGGTALSDRVVVAGGGGGRGNRNGGAGGEVGGDASTFGGAAAGLGGTASAGGAGGPGQTTGGSPCPTAGGNGSAGASGVGGAGGNAGGGGPNHPGGGAGGGGGYYGGGGGGAACDQMGEYGGGGGGSSYAHPTLTSSVSYVTGDRSGNGIVTITYSVPVAAIDASGSGRSLTGSGSTFPASSTVTFTIGGVTVGTVTTDTDGAFTFDLTDIDCSVTSGTLTATSGAVTATDTFTLDPCPDIDATATGRGITGSGSAFPASSTVTLTIGGVTVGTATTDENGDFTFDIADIDCSVASGTLIATSGDDEASIAVTLEPCPNSNPSSGRHFAGIDFSGLRPPTTTPPTDPLPVTGTSSMGLMGFAVALLISGTGLAIVTARRRRTLLDHRA